MKRKQITIHRSLTSVQQGPLTIRVGPRRGPGNKTSVAQAWLQFQADIEAAMLRKPGRGTCAAHGRNNLNKKKLFLFLFLFTFFVYALEALLRIGAAAF